MNKAIILAGGLGTRLPSRIPKQFLNLGGQRMVNHVMNACILSQNVDTVLVVCHKNYTHLIHAMLKDAHLLKKNIEVIEGGEGRIESTRLGLTHFSPQKDDTTILLEANRPLVTAEHIDQLYADFIQEKATCAFYFSRMKESLFHVQEDGEKEWLDKSKFMVSQTPYIFSADAVKKIIQTIQKNDCPDDRDVINFISRSKKTIAKESHFLNIKVTFPRDLLFSAWLMEMENGEI
jgi:2-C-methyl-D-erythritol 4-phosphate cytidylyltransferase